MRGSSCGGWLDPPSDAISNRVQVENVANLPHTPERIRYAGIDP